MLLLTLILIIMDTSGELFKYLFRAIPENGKARIILYFFAFSNKTCRILLMSFSSIFPVMLPLPEDAVFLEPSKRPTYVYYMKRQRQMCLRFAQKRIMPGVTRGIAVSSGYTLGSYTLAVFCFFVLYGRAAYHGLIYFYPDKV